MGIVLISLVAAILLESTITTLPLVLLIILFSTVVIRKTEMFAIAFFSGLFLDILTLGIIGLSSLYFTVLVLIVFLYQKKFEIETLHFIIIFSFLGSFGYLLLEGVKFAFFQSILATIFTLLSFMAFKVFNKKAHSYGSG